MNIVITIIIALFGVAIGSFLNVCADRLPRGKSLIRPGSHCDHCRHPLSPKDLIPIVSYLWMRGQCRYCHKPVALRVLLVEAGTGLMFAFLYWFYGSGVHFTITAFYGCIFIIILVIDLEHHIIPNKIVYPAAGAALIIDTFLPGPGIVNGLIGGAIGFVFLLIPALVSPKGMGWGDVKMAGLIGLVTGFPLVLVALIVAIVPAGIFAIILLLLKMKNRKEAIPFGPFLSLATMVALLWGDHIPSYYLSLF